MEFIAKGAFATGKYRNVFQEYGYKQEEIENRKNEIFQTIFYGTEEERLYHPVEPDMGYIEDTGNHDVRTEGMSYGMMMCVQMDKKEEFDRLWKWVMTYMYMTTGDNAGYFAWSCQTDGKKSVWCRTRRRGIFCDGSIFRLTQMGRRRGNFLL